VEKSKAGEGNRSRLGDVRMKGESATGWLGKVLPEKIT
jgi:hypothetical protein